ncbi:MAG: RNA methyltransferase, partial [Atopostipes suicloacalis]|nr:RNA methyltransferase [Atopostipes suicloacalis]
MREIRSLNNPQVKSWRKLQKKKERKKTNSYLIEGFHLIEEAFQYKREQINKLIMREDLLDEATVKELIHRIDADNLFVVAKEIAQSISMTETNQGIFAEIKIKEKENLTEITGPFLLLDAVQDPGNVGTMIRTADAAGFQAVILGKGTVDLYNDKTLRAAQGSHFHLDIYERDLI